MERFKAFVGRQVRRTRCDDGKILAKAGLVPRYLPEEFHEIDEMEFAVPLEGEKTLVLSAALEQGKIMRILLGWTAPGDPEDFMRPLEDDAVARALELRGDDLLRFLEDVTS